MRLAITVLVSLATAFGSTVFSGSQISFPDGSNSSTIAYARAPGQTDLQGGVDEPFSAASASFFYSFPFYIGPPVGTVTETYTYTATSYGSLASGALGVTGSANITPYLIGGGDSQSWPYAESAFREVVTFHSSAALPVVSFIDINIDGSESNALTFFILQMRYGGGSLQSVGCTLIEAGPTYCSGNLGTYVGTVGRVSLSLPVLVSGDTQVTLFEDLSTSVQPNGYSLYGHTAQTSIDVPVGVTWTSQSNVFLTGAATTEIPEPGTGFLVLAALFTAVIRRSGTSGSLR